MFIEDIVNLLRNNLDYDFVFDSADAAKDCVVYSYSPRTDDGVKALYQLSLRIICKGRNEAALVRVEKMKRAIQSKIITLGDNPLTQNILNVYQNGGGVMVDYDTDTTHEIMYYDIIYKEV